MQLDAMPRQTAFRHRGGRDGFEIVFIETLGDGHVLRGVTTAVENGVTWSVSYDVALDHGWRTTSVTVVGRSAAGDRAMSAERGPKGVWVVDGSVRPDLDGCVDIDLESSLVTNTMPVHRLPADGARHDTPAAFVRADSLAVERLEQSYQYLGRGDEGPAFAYESQTFDFSCRLVFDASGLVTEYPGLGHRHRDAGDLPSDPSRPGTA